jgi:hypothetical protein
LFIVSLSQLKPSAIAVSFSGSSLSAFFPAINTVFFLFHLFHLSPFALLQHAPE